MIRYSSLPNDEYWEDRFELLEKRTHERSLEVYESISKTYDKAIADLDKDLSYWYHRFAKNENLTLGEAKRVLNKNELSAFHMSVEDYIKHGESLDPKWMAELERASVKWHVTRLEAMKLQMRQHAEEVSGNTAFKFKDFGVKTYSERYYQTAFEVQKGLHVGWDFHKIDEKKIEDVISRPWLRDGANFSDRIWSDRTKLVNELNETLTSALARGEDPRKTIDKLVERMNVSRSNAGRLVMTESAFFASSAQLKSFEELGVERFKFVATLDAKTSEICREHDGKTYDIDDYVIGTNVPPLHPWCRSTTIAVIDPIEGFESLRAARNKDTDDGYYTIPSDITYREWQAGFVEKKEPVKSLEIHKDCNIYKRLGTADYQELHARILKGSKTQCDLWNKYEDQLKVANRKYQKTAHFDPKIHGIRIDLEKTANDEHAPYRTLVHELAHNLDYVAGNNSYASCNYKDNVFGKTIQSEIDAHIAETKTKLESGKIKLDNAAYSWYKLKHAFETPKEEWKVFSQLQKILSDLPYAAQCAVSDMFDGGTKGMCHGKFAHGPYYWDENNINLAIEAFAEMWEALACEEELELIKEWFPKSYVVFLEILEHLNA